MDKSTLWTSLAAFASGEWELSDMTFLGLQLDLFSCLGFITDSVFFTTK